MGNRLLCSTILAAVVALTGCTDKSSTITLPTSPDNNPTNQTGNDSTSSPKVGPGDSQGTQIVDNTGKPKPDASASAPVRDAYDDPDTPEPVPEPGTILLFGVGATGLAFYRRRRNAPPAVQSV